MFSVRWIIGKKFIKGNIFLYTNLHGLEEENRQISSLLGEEVGTLQLRGLFSLFPDVLSLGCAFEKGNVKAK